MDQAYRCPHQQVHTTSKNPSRATKLQSEKIVTHNNIGPELSTNFTYLDCNTLLFLFSSVFVNAKQET